jgi:hypothetical protein
MSAAGKKWLTITLLALGGVFVLVGILRGETFIVLKKATLICLECIGIG